MMKPLVSGIAASRLFRELQKQDSSIGPRELADLLMKEFPEISLGVCITINRWSGKGSVAVSDEDLDALISHLIKEAGYGS